MKHTKESDAIKCKYCGKKIAQTRLIGFSLICPLCGMPQNGQSQLSRTLLFSEILKT